MIKKFWPFGKRKNLLALLVFAVFILVVFRKFIFQGQIPIPGDILLGVYYPWLDSKWGFIAGVPVKNNLPSDIVSIIYPWRILSMNFLRQGILPFWDQTILLGAPLLANFQSAVLNPLNVLYLVLANEYAWGIQVVLQLFILFGGTYLFLKDLKLDKYASCFGALLFTFSGYSLVWLGYNSIIYTVSYFPILLFLARRIAYTAKPKWIFAYGIALALQIFSGYPLSSLYSVFFSGVYLVFCYFQEKFNFKIAILSFALAVASGLGLSAIQLLPGYELNNLSIRNFDTTAQAGSIKYLPLTHIISFFIPDYFGNPGTGNYWSEGSYDNFAFFIPAAGIFFFLLSLITRIALKKENLVFLLFFLTGIFLAIRNPVSEAFLSSNVASRVLFVSSFGAAVLAAKAFSYATKRKIGFLVRVVPVILYSVLILGTIIGMYFSSRINNQVISARGAYEISQDTNIKEVDQFAKETEKLNDGFKVAFRNTAIPSGIILLCFLLLLIKNKKLLFFGLCILVLFSTKVSFDKYLSFTPKDLVFPETELTKKLESLVGEHRFLAERAELTPSNTWSLYNLKSASGQHALAPLATARYLNLINTSALKDDVLSRYLEVTNLKSPLVNTLDVEYFIALNRDPKLSIPSAQGRPYPWIIPSYFTEVANIGTVRVYRNTRNLGPAWFAQSVICENDIQKVAKIITDPGYDPEKLVVVDCEGTTLKSFGKAEVKLTDSSPNFLKFETKLPNENFLVVSKSVFPGWKVTIDGRPTEIRSANIGLTSVLVPEGTHMVEFRYQPESFKKGLVISALTLALWLGILARGLFLRS